MRSPVLLSLSLLVAACAGLPTPAPREFLDETTALTLTVADAPWLLARERKDVAAHARDYLTLVPVERNAAGRYSLALVVHRWSTVDARVAAPVAGPPPALVFVVDGRDLRLAPAPVLPREFAGGDGRLWEPADTWRTTYAYPVDRSAFELLAGSRELYAYFDEPSEGAVLGPWHDWRDGREALARFLAATHHVAR
jgi:hypothetical protein